MRETLPEERESGETDPRAESLWVAEIERRAREVAESKVDMVDADEVHAEIAERLRRRTGRPTPTTAVGEGILRLTASRRGLKMG